MEEEMDHPQTSMQLWLVKLHLRNMLEVSIKVLFLEQVSELESAVVSSLTKEMAVVQIGLLIITQITHNLILSISKEMTPKTLQVLMVEQTLTGQ